MSCSEMETLCALFDEGGCNGEEFSLYFWDEEMTPEYEIPPSEVGVGTTHTCSGK